MSTNLQIGIVGLPNVGKSTLFNAITKAGAEAANFPFCTIEPNIGVVEVPDHRLYDLAGLFHPKKTTPAFTRFVDIAGLVAGASKGEGLGNQFLSHIRETDAIAHVVRCFEDGNITHVAGHVDPVRDMDIINTELCLADLDVVDKRRSRVAKMAQAGLKETKQELSVLNRVFQVLEEGHPARQAELSDDDRLCLKELNLLTLKPVLYVLNVGEDDIADPMSNSFVQAAVGKAEEEKASWVPISAEIEAEVSELDPEEAAAFLSDLGEKEPGLNRLIRSAYSLLGLINFFTVGPDECRSWTIAEGTRAPRAAGKIHTDIERGFIRAEVISYDQLMQYGSFPAAREKGVLRLEGKDYIMQDGDVVYFRFNV
jgi:GTP-binding protein YchF